MISSADVIISVVEKVVVLVTQYVIITEILGVLEIVNPLVMRVVSPIIQDRIVVVIVVIIHHVDLIMAVLKMLHQQNVLLLVLVIINVIVNQDIKLGLADANLEM